MSRRPHRLRHRLIAASLAAVFVAAWPDVAAAQVRENQRGITVLPDTADAQATREAFREILRTYPPALSRILRLDAAVVCQPDGCPSIDRYAPDVRDGPGARGCEIDRSSIARPRRQSVERRFSTHPA